MAQPLVALRKGEVIVRGAEPDWGRLVRLVFSRYPQWEWATFARFGWRRTREDNLVLTLAGIDEPGSGELDASVGHVAFQEPYVLRTALAAEHHRLAVGVIHSHPRDYVPRPSTIDDDMDAYYADYFAGFAPGRPYVSLILAAHLGELVMSGRTHVSGEWREVTSVASSPRTELWGAHRVAARRERTARLAAAFGQDAQARLRESHVAVIGAGGTGSPAIEVLARAGVGNLTIIDPDSVEASNLERVHGSYPVHVDGHTHKAEVARQHVAAIDPACNVTAIVGALPQDMVLDAIVGADVVLGCTDQQHSRLALSELAYRYLVPTIDCGVMLEGSVGRVTGQIMQFIRFLPADACALCRGMIQSQRLAQELMSPQERSTRRRAAQEALARGDAEGAYWQDEPQLNTVGYLTTAAGALAAGYAIGWISGRFEPPFSRLQMNLVAPFLDVTDQPMSPQPECVCHRVRGWADQGAEFALISAPSYWPEPYILDATTRVLLA